VEAMLLAYEAVSECAMIGLPDEARGQVVAAFVVLKPDVLPDEVTAMRLQDHVNANIAPYKYPRTVRFLEALPKTQTGMIQRFQLKFLQ
jgi:2-aminobenzoate-CoA ligase